MPYVEDFENFNINETLPCWIAVGYSFVPLVSYIPSTYYGNKKSKMLRFSNGPTLYASPVITTDIRNTQISFLLSQSGSNAGVFKVGVMSDISDESTFELVKRITMNNYNEQEFFQISLANINLSGPNKYIVFKHEIINNIEISPDSLNLLMILFNV